VLAGRERGGCAGRDGVDASDDAARVRLDDLAAILEIHLVAVVFGRVVAGGEVDAGRGFRETDGERKLGRRSGALEEARVAAIFDDDLRRKFSELAGEMPRVVRDANRRNARPPLARVKVPHVGGEAARGAIDVGEIHRIRARAGMLGASVWPARALLGCRHAPADRLAAESARSEGKRAKKAVVEFAPVPALEQLADGFARDGIGVCGEQGANVCRRGFQQIARGRGLVEQGNEVTHGGDFRIRAIARQQAPALRAAARRRRTSARCSSRAVSRE